ncbi:MAG: hypothetical protein ACI956_000385 [Nonlabens sp.]|jgi:hypothetical protein
MKNEEAIIENVFETKDRPKRSSGKFAKYQIIKSCIIYSKKALCFYSNNVLSKKVFKSLFRAKEPLEIGLSTGLIKGK